MQHMRLRGHLHGDHWPHRKVAVVFSTFRRHRRRHAVVPIFVVFVVVLIVLAQFFIVLGQLFIVLVLLLILLGQLFIVLVLLLVGLVLVGLFVWIQRRLIIWQQQLKHVVSKQARV